MGEPTLTFREIAAHLPTGPSFVPTADLWPRIAAAHERRRRRRRASRIGAGFACAVALVAVAALSWSSRQVAPPLDWQARAQALEIELKSLGAPRAAGVDRIPPSDAAAELSDVDGALQAAYDRGATKDELARLWKKRSELLSALVVARQQQLTLTRI